MIYNKNQVRKVDDKKVLHKIGKHWQVVSLALLMVIGGVTVSSTHVSAQNTSIKNNQATINDPTNQSSSHLIKNRINQNLKQIYNNQNKISSTNQGRTNAINITNDIQQQADILHNRILRNASQNSSHNYTLKNKNTNQLNNPSELKEFHKDYNLKSITPNSLLSNNDSTSNYTNSFKNRNQSSYVSKPTTNIVNNKPINVNKKIKKIKINHPTVVEGQNSDHGLNYTYDPFEQSVTFHGTVNFDGKSLLSGFNIPSDIKNAQNIFFSDVNIGKHRNMSNAFSGDSNVTTINFGSTFNNLTTSNFDSSTIESRKQTGIDMSHMFQNDTNLNTVDLKDLDTREVNNMAYMFASDKAMTMFGNYDDNSADRSYKVTGFNNNDYGEPDFISEYRNPETQVSDYPSNLSSSNGFATGEIQDKTQNFNIHRYEYGRPEMSDNTTGSHVYQNLETNFITNNVTDMNHMFANDSNLSFADLSGMNFNTKNVEDMSYMFYNDTFQNIGYPNANQFFDKVNNNDNNVWDTLKTKTWNGVSDNYNSNRYANTNIGDGTNTLAKLPGNEINNNTLLLGRTYSDDAPFVDTLVNDGANFAYSDFFKNQYSTNNQEGLLSMPGGVAEISSDQAPKQILASLNNKKNLMVSKSFNGVGIYYDQQGSDVGNMPQGKTRLETGFRTDNVTNMSHMFANNKDAGSIDLHFDTDNLRDMSYMFENVGKGTVDSSGHSNSPFHQEVSESMSYGPGNPDGPGVSEAFYINGDTDLFNLGNQSKTRYQEGQDYLNLDRENSDYYYSDQDAPWESGYRENKHQKMMSDFTSDSGIHPSDSDYIHSDFHLANVKDMEGAFKGLVVAGNNFQIQEGSLDNKNITSFEQSLQKLQPSNYLKNTGSLFSDLYLNVLNFNAIPNFKKDLNNWDLSNDRNMKNMFRNIARTANQQDTEGINVNNLILPDKFNTQSAIDISDMFADNPDINLELSSDFDTTSAKGHMKNFYALTKEKNAQEIRKMIIKSNNTIFDNNVSANNTMFRDTLNRMEYIQAQRPIDTENMGDDNSHVGNWDGVDSALISIRLKYPDGHYQYLSDSSTKNEKNNDSDELYMNIPSDLQKQGYQFTESDFKKYQVASCSDTYMTPPPFNIIKQANKITPSDYIVITPTKDGAPSDFDPNKTIESDTYDSDENKLKEYFPVYTYTANVEHDVHDVINFNLLYPTYDVQLNNLSINQKYDTHKIKKGNTYYHVLQQSDIPKGWAVVDNKGNIIKNLSSVLTPFVNNKTNSINVAPLYDGMTYSSDSYTVTFHSGSMQNGNHFYNNMMNTNNSQLNTAQKIVFDNGVDTSKVTNLDNAFSHVNTDPYSDMNLREVDLPNNFAPNVTSVKQMFNNSDLHTIKWGNNFMQNLRNTSDMFNGCTNLSDITFPRGFGANITNASNMFNGASMQNLQLDSDFGKKLTDVSNMFNKAQIINPVKFPNGTYIKNARYMFYNSNINSIQLSSDFGKNLSNANHMFSNIPLNTPLYIPNGKYITNASDMFSNLPLENKITFDGQFGQLIANGNNMFNNDISLSDLELPSDFGQQIISAKQMFNNNSKLSNMNLPKNFNTASANDLSDMFANNNNLKSITLSSDFSTTNHPSIKGLIKNDSKLNYINAKSSDISLDKSILGNNENILNKWYQVSDNENGIDFTVSDITNLIKGQNITQGTWLTHERLMKITQPILHFINKNDNQVIASDDLGIKIGNNDYVGYNYHLQNSDVPTNFKLANNQSSDITIDKAGRNVYNVDIIPSISAGNITVDYVNESGKLLSEQTINCNNKYGQTINVLKDTTMPQSNNYQISKYNFRSDYQVTNKNQLITIPLIGKYTDRQHDKYNQIKINLYKVNSDNTKSLDSYKSLYLNGQIGNYIDLNAKDYLPNNCNIDSNYINNYQFYLRGVNSHKAEGILYNSNGNKAVNGNTINFYYKTIPNKAGSITIHYRIYNSDGDSQPSSNTTTLNFDKNDIGKSINVSSNVPYYYNLMPNQYLTYRVTKENQNITLNVRVQRVTINGNNPKYQLNIFNTANVYKSLNEYNNSDADINYNQNGFQDGISHNNLRPFSMDIGQSIIVSPNFLVKQYSGLKLLPYIGINDTHPKIMITCNKNSVSVSPTDADFTGYAYIEQNNNNNNNGNKKNVSNYHTNTIFYISSSDLGNFSYDQTHNIDWQKNHSFVTTITNHGTTSDKFSDATYRENVPEGYQFVKVYKTNNNISSVGLHNFANNNQSEVIEVIPNASPIIIHYINSDGKLIKSYKSDGNMNNPIKNDGVHGYTSKFNQVISSNQIDTPTKNYNQLGVPIGYKIAIHNNHTAEDQLFRFNRQLQNINVMVNTPKQEGKIKVVYINHGKQIGNSDVITGIVGDKVNVTNTANGGLAIPNGYSLLGGMIKSNHNNNSDVKGITQDTVYNISKNPYTVYLKINGNNENDRLNVTRIIYLRNGKSIKSTVPVNISGSNNSVKELKPSDFNPNKNKYNSASDDNNQYVRIENNQITPNNVNFYYYSNIGTVTIRYVNFKNGQIVSTPININGKYGQNINLNSQDNVPKGYKLLSNNPQNIIINHPIQDINLYVQGKEVNNVLFNIRRIKENQDGNLTNEVSDAPIKIKGNIGDTININPYFFNKDSLNDSDIQSIYGGGYNYRIPYGYHATASDADIKIRINSDGSISPVNNIDYVYQKDYDINNVNLSTIKVHYITSDNDNGDGKIDNINGTNYHEIDVESDKGISNQDSFDLTPYLHDVPESVSNYYSLNSNSLPFNQDGNQINKKNYKFKFPNQSDNIYIKVDNTGNSPIIL